MRRILRGFLQRWALLTDREDYSRRSIPLTSFREVLSEDKNRIVGLCCKHMLHVLLRYLLHLFSNVPNVWDMDVILYFSPFFSFQFFLPSGEIKSTVWTRQDSSGARSQDTHFEGGQGCCYTHSAYKKFISPKNDYTKSHLCRVTHWRGVFPFLSWRGISLCTSREIWISDILKKCKLHLLLHTFTSE